MINNTLPKLSPVRLGDKPILPLARGPGNRLGPAVHPLILAPHNDDVQWINDIIINQIVQSNFERTYYSADSADCDQDEPDVFPPHFLHSFNCSQLPPHQLRLKPGVPILLIRNINPDGGLANGTRLTVKELKETVITY